MRNNRLCENRRGNCCDHSSGEESVLHGRGNSKAWMNIATQAFPLIANLL
jgi:hypothetical protein